MKLQIPNDLFESLNNITRFQNTILLKEICRDYNWDYNALKKKYIKDKIIKDKIIKKELMEEEPAKNIKKKIKKKQVEEEEEKPIILGKRKIKVKKVRRKRKPKEDEMECKIIKFKTRNYYITEEDNYAYDIDGDFCGILEDDNTINFNAEPAI